MKWYAGSILLLVVAWVFQLALLAYAMYTLLGVLIASRMLARVWAQSLSATRETSRPTAEVGDKVAVAIKVRNRGALPIAWVLLEDLLPRHALIHEPPNLQVRGRRMQLAMLRGRGSKSVLYQMQCNRRGYYQIGPLVLETGDLFGLHRRFRVLTEPTFLLVYPQVIPLDGYDIASRRPIGEVRMTHRLFEDPTRISGVRAYALGDPLNRIHWKATARSGALQSKVYEPSTLAGATIVLDFHQDSYPRRDEPYRSELAITAAASLANAVYQIGEQVGLVSNARDAADRIREEGWAPDARTRRAARQSASMRDRSDRLRPAVVATRRGAEQLTRILELLGRAELTDGLSFPELIQETTSRLPRDASVIALLTSVTYETAIVLGNLRRSGYAVTAILNAHDTFEFSEAAGMLLAEGVEARHLTDRDAIVSICQRQVLM